MLNDEGGYCRSTGCSEHYLGFRSRRRVGVMTQNSTYPMGDLTVTRMGYGSMQLTGPGVMGPPPDRDGALAVLRALPGLGVTHVDTAGFYGPHVTNELIREALHPYDDLTVVTKVGYDRDETGGWVPANTPAQLRQQVEENLKRLGVEALDVANLRLGDPMANPSQGSIAEPFAALAQMQAEGKIRHLGLSVVNAAQVAEAQTLAPVVTVQNLYNIAHRSADDALIDSLAAQGISFVPFFPLGGFSPLQSSVLSGVAERLHTRPAAVALAWLLQRSPNILLIPGTSSVAHLRENVAAADLVLDEATAKELDAIGA
ncbi:aldo/keto reductase family oxidoreductase [Kineosporia mesophila]|uniref:Aldo/keto reductase family oxidoreductase n=2 Tax=Kineosporia mesophila TaxID=566012 RepID=A0ABP7A025_9ACTN